MLFYLGQKYSNKAFPLHGLPCLRLHAHLQMMIWEKFQNDPEITTFESCNQKLLFLMERGFAVMALITAGWQQKLKRKKHKVDLGFATQLLKNS